MTMFEILLIVCLVVIIGSVVMIVRIYLELYVLRDQLEGYMTQDTRRHHPIDDDITRVRAKPGSVR